MKQKGYHWFLFLVGILMLCLNLLDAPTLSDDIIYRFLWQQDEAAPVQAIHSVGDLLQSQWNHYLSTNGRWVVHLLAQGFLVFVPPVVLQVLNTLLFVLLVHLSVRWTGVGRWQRFFVATMVFFLLFAVFQGFRTTMLWSLGTFNYLWVLVATLGLLLWLRGRREEEGVKRIDMLLVPLAFFVGCSHEALSLPLSVGFFVWLIMNRREVSLRVVLPYACFYWLGMVVILLSPGIWNRSTEGISLTSRLISGAVNLVFNMRLFWLLAIALLVLWKCRRSLLKAHLRENITAYVALLVSVGIVALCGTNLERVCFFTDFIAMLLLLQILSATLSEAWQKGLSVLACVVVLMLMVPAYMVRKENYNNWLYAEQQMREPGRELIAVRCPVFGNSTLMDYFRNHYINPSFSFGFYCSYMGFDADDINMRCAARLYGKERMLFLPEDVVQHIETDSTAFTQPEPSADKSLYVWQLPDTVTTVSKVTFVLNDEDFSQLFPHQRLLAYRDDTFELDDFNFELVHVHSRPYLVFTRPTTNIFRRINHIVYE